MNKKIFFYLILTLILFTPPVWALKFPDPELAGKPNPHWTGKSCLECHEKKPEKGKPATYKFGGDFNKLCKSCHDTALFRLEEHIVGIKLQEDPYIKQPPQDFLLPEGKISCVTCHDLRLQEYPNPSIKEKNPMFLRRAPYKDMLTFEWAKSEMDIRYRQSRYGLCLYCHKMGPLLQWSPHKNQITSRGEINKQMCLFCHFEVPDRDAIEVRDWKLRGKLQDHCKGCHMGKTRYHPIRVTHYGNTLPDKIKNQIKFSQKRLKIIIPLDTDAQGVLRVTCPSCHNPHQRGVLKNIATRRGADANKKLRVDGFGMCLACHGQAVGVPTSGAPF